MAIDQLPYQSEKLAARFAGKVAKPWPIKYQPRNDDWITKGLYDLLSGDDVEDALHNYYQKAKRGWHVEIQSPVKRLVKKLMQQQIKDGTIESFPPKAVETVAAAVGIKWRAPKSAKLSPANIVRILLLKKYDLEIHSAFWARPLSKKEFIVIAAIYQKGDQLTPTEVKKLFREKRLSGVHKVIKHKKVTTVELNKILKGKHDIIRVSYYPQMCVSNYFKIRFRRERG